MSCACDQPLFRLLDHRVGWDPLVLDQLAGSGSESGLRLEEKVSFKGSIPADLIDPYLPPTRLAHTCHQGRLDWYLVTPQPPQSRLLLLDPCNGLWTQPRGELEDLVDARAVAAWQDLVAVATVSALHIRRTWGTRRSVVIPIQAPGPMTFIDGVLLAVHGEPAAIHAYGRGGGPLETLPLQLPPGLPKRLAASPAEPVGDDCPTRLWLVTAGEEGALFLWHALTTDMAFQPASPDELAQAFADNGLTEVSAAGFQMRGLGEDCRPLQNAYSWYGRPSTVEAVRDQEPPRFKQQGQLITRGLDSGKPRCRWHRVRLDAAIPEGTTLALAVATSEVPDPPDQGTALAPWQDFPSGPIHPQDWQEAAPGALDFLIDQPAGRYLFLRLRLTGNGVATPHVRQIHIDFPRITSLDHLPAVYRQDPRAEDFSERFLSLLDASLEQVDRATDRFPALLDSQHIPAEALPWLGRFLDLVFDPTWDGDRRRKVLAALPALFRKRGTLAGLHDAITLVFDVLPVIVEGAADRAAAALGRDSRLGTLRLFGRAGARFLLGSSTLSGAPLRSQGEPSLDPFHQPAWRARVMVPPGDTPIDDSALQALIESQKPAHTQISVSRGGRGWVAGIRMAVGIDTAFVRLPPPILGAAGNIRLGRDSILPAERGPIGFRAGLSSALPGGPLHD